MTFSNAMISVVFWLWLGSCILGQAGSQTWEIRSRIDGPKAHSYLGSSLAGLGDVNGDGYDDILIGSPEDGATLRSGFDLQLIRAFVSPAQPDEFGAAVSAAGDFDLDGHDDVLIGAPREDPAGLSDAGSAFVYSGRTKGILPR